MRTVFPHAHSAKPREAFSEEKLRYTRRSRTSLAFVLKRSDLLVKPEILSDSAREIIVCLQFVNVAPEFERQTLNIFGGGCPRIWNVHKFIRADSISF